MSSLTLNIMLFFPVTPQDASFRGSAVGRAGEAVDPGRRRLDSLTVTLQSKHVCFKFYQKCSAVRNKPQSLQLSRLNVKGLMSLSSSPAPRGGCWRCFTGRVLCLKCRNFLGVKLYLPFALNN